jgi:hypothetical protein
MTIRSRGARIPNAAWCAEAGHAAFVSRQEPEYGSCTVKVRSHRKAVTKSSAAPRMLDTVTVTFTDHGAERQPVVSAERADQDQALDFAGTPVRTIVFPALPGLALSLGTPGQAEIRRMSPYSGVSSLSYCRVLPVMRGTVHAPQ